MKTQNEGKAIGKYIRVSSNKVNRVLDQIRGKTYEEAKLILTFMPYKVCKIINKILESAASNAINDSANNKNGLTIKEAFVNKGPTLKRFQPRAQGRAFKIQKPTCHITITVYNM